MSQPAPLTNLRFLLTLLVGVVLLLAMGAAFNFIVDPYASFRWNDIKGFNDQKTLRRDGGRVNKALILGHTKFDVLLYGSSRGEMGLDPQSPALSGALAFNASLSATNIVELSHAIDYAARHQSPKLVVIGLDLLLFGSQVWTSGDFDRSGFAGASAWPVYVRRLLSLQSFDDSGWVLFSSVKGLRQSFAKDGTYDIGARKKGFDHRAEMDSVLHLQLSLPGSERTYGGFRYAPERMEDLRRILSAFDNGKTRVVLFVTPIHAKVLEAKAGAGLLPAWEQWKRDLAATVAESHAELWDFSGFNAITTEDIPRDPATRMHWYWDGSHFTKAAGNLILERIISGKDDPSFGIRLTSDNVETVINRIRSERTAYAAAHPDEVAEVRALAEASGISRR
ncbi:hypothetical protein [Paramagnetospirillum magneticum]|uniref:Uncharacterized protein n=1 Tax=Paramagnetospirillum magneticum (strain ATCC 700264 / AMB-1) TaxID=342108 RepID=Q2WB17_PARM1|nr:hypothetical protein [Paramagnetospirillum magneticum]BAE48958.1 hypothetical protein amb0154 [Paramagnetospirillum magneticum AMB-1]